MLLGSCNFALSLKWSLCFAHLLYKQHFAHLAFSVLLYTLWPVLGLPIQSQTLRHTHTDTLTLLICPIREHPGLLDFLIRLTSTLSCFFLCCLFDQFPVLFFVFLPIFFLISHVNPATMFFLESLELFLVWIFPAWIQVRTCYNLKAQTLTWWMKISHLLATRLFLHAAAVPEVRRKVKSVCEASLFNSCKLIVCPPKTVQIREKCSKLEHENSCKGQECCGSTSLTKDTPSESVKKKNGCAEVEMPKRKWIKSHAEGVTKALHAASCEQDQQHSIE